MRTFLAAVRTTLGGVLKLDRRGPSMVCELTGFARFAHTENDLACQRRVWVEHVVTDMGTYSRALR